MKKSLLVDFDMLGAGNLGINMSGRYMMHNFSLPCLEMCALSKEIVDR
jgi:hypothetical protein